MENTSYIALSRQMGLWRQLEVTANNMANANTPGFKAEQMMFREHLMATRSTERAIGDKLSFVQDFGTVRDTREGALAKTDNPFDFAIHGEGWFQVESEAGMRYTRNGHFRLDDNGMVVTTNGFAVMDENDNPIILAPNESRVEVSQDGTISTENGALTRIKVVRFASEQEMRKAGDTLFETTQTPEPIGRPFVAQGMVEESNVQPVMEVTRMTQILHQYQAMQKMIDNEHERQSKAMDVLVPRA